MNLEKALTTLSLPIRIFAERKWTNMVDESFLEA